MQTPTRRLFGIALLITAPFIMACDDGVFEPALANTDSPVLEGPIDASDGSQGSDQDPSRDCTDTRDSQDTRLETKDPGSDTQFRCPR